MSPDEQVCGACGWSKADDQKSALDASAYAAAAQLPNHSKSVGWIVVAVAIVSAVAFLYAGTTLWSGRDPDTTASAPRKNERPDSACVDLSDPKKSFVLKGQLTLEVWDHPSVADVHSYILKLDQPVCMTGDEEGYANGVHATMHLTHLLGTDDEDVWSKWIGKRVLVTSDDVQAGMTIWDRGTRADVVSMRDATSSRVIWTRNTARQAQTSPPVSAPPASKPFRLDDASVSLVGVWNLVTREIGADSLRLRATPGNGYMLGLLIFSLLSGGGGAVVFGRFDTQNQLHTDD